MCLIAKLSSNNHLYLIDMLRVRTTFPDFSRRALALCDKYRVRRAIGEANGPQKGLVQQLNETSNFPIMPAKRDTDKVTRAVATQSFVESGRLHLPCGDNAGKPNSVFVPLYDEMTTFPIAAHDDSVDAVVDLMTVASTMRKPEPPTRIRNEDETALRLGRVYG